MAIALLFGPMPRFHHVNLGVPPDAKAAEATFLIEVLGYRQVDPGERLTAMGANWFEGEDGAQVHLSADPDHHPSARAHVAVELGDDLPTIEQRLSEGGYDVRRVGGDADLRVVFCRDPAGNQWELRGPQPVS